MQTIDVQRLANKQATGEIDLIDVRMPTEYREVHAVGAQNFPLDVLDPKQIAAARNGRSHEPLYVICKSGNRSSKAVQKFLDAGIENVVNVEGGTTAWVAAGLSVVRGQKAISLERQVRITAGSIVLIGSVAAIVTGNAYLAGIPAFIGAGLVFAGITDTCGMGMMLSKLPWNKCSDTGSCSV
jgi:rhodanese-related sulfurtransferase